MIGHSLQEADLSLKADDFLSKNYLLIHGTADTLVHQQHTMLLTKSLIQQGVIFRHQVRWQKFPSSFCWDRVLKGIIFNTLYPRTGLHWWGPWTGRRHISRAQDNWILHGRQLRKPWHQRGVGGSRLLHILQQGIVLGQVAVVDARHRPSHYRTATSLSSTPKVKFTDVDFYPKIFSPSFDLIFPLFRGEFFLHHA